VVEHERPTDTDGEDRRDDTGDHAAAAHLASSEQSLATGRGDQLLGHRSGEAR
jgi:hypothetical protein